ncbi:hypothetical protein F0562_000270 [Nyssa sinensis]|uniref:adenylate dimethylallyltransferase (ADP/ATP-dependent) n=1 Tax=Nyssa sinensis TaxID=561372 RepID=A0A5J5C103_9ASTE|nr:hypothetical protein F0562_000270 [Nyssa sinensis]
MGAKLQRRRLPEHLLGGHASRRMKQEEFCSFAPSPSSAKSSLQGFSFYSSIRRASDIKVDHEAVIVSRLQTKTAPCEFSRGSKHGPFRHPTEEGQDPNVDFTAADFRHHASAAIDSIVRRDRLPIIAGGSNSFIKALVNDDIEFQSKYECCFLLVDVSLPVLHSFVSDRVDRMVKAGLVDEVRRFFDSKADYKRGIRRAIGVPEMNRFLLAESAADDETQARLLEEAIDEIKGNTCKLACCQLQNILRLQNQFGWDLHRLDATEAFLKRGGEAEKAWEKLVALPSNMIVSQFLYKDDFVAAMAAQTASSVLAATTPAVAAAAH